MKVNMEAFFKKLKDPKKEIGLVREGIDFNLIETFLKKEELPVKDVLKRLHISASTYFQRKNQHKLLDSASTEKLLRLVTVKLFAAEILGEQEAKLWLFKPVPSLNEVPINLLDTEAGHRLVMQTLLQIKYGMYS